MVFIQKQPHINGTSRTSVTIEPLPFLNAYPLANALGSYLKKSVVATTTSRRYGQDRIYLEIDNLDDQTFQNIVDFVLKYHPVEVLPDEPIPT
jgi:hypothetical protein